MGKYYGKFGRHLLKNLEKNFLSMFIFINFEINTLVKINEII